MSQEALVVMRRYLVVANQTLQRAELRDELRHRTEAEPRSFYLLVPDTPAADYPDVPAAADVLQPGMTWWATDYRGPASDEEATWQARQRLGQMLAELDALGIPPRVSWAAPAPWRRWRRRSPISRSTGSSWPRCPGTCRAGCGPTCRTGPSAGSGCRSPPSSPGAATMPPAVPAPVAAVAHQSVGAAYAAAGTIAALGHPALGLALHHASTNAFLRGLTLGSLVAGGVAAAGALLAALFLPAQPAQPASPAADQAGTAEAAREAEAHADPAPPGR